MKEFHTHIILIISTMAVISSVCVQAERSYSPESTSSLGSVFWGDTHLHTNVSPDGSGLGNSLTPDQAYRFARGETVIAPNGMKARLQRPLDFLVIADHAVNMGVLSRAHAADPALNRTEAGRFWLELVKDNPELKSWETYISKDFKKSKLRTSMLRLFHPNDMTGVNSNAPINFVEDQEFRQSVWQEVTEKADIFNDPGSFTAFIGYEWTPSQIQGMGKGYGNFHRVVLFKDGAEKTKKILPFSRLDSQNPEDLWSFLSEYESNLRGEVIAIPHNSNATRGAMFALTDLNGKPLSADYAMKRSYWEPILEVTQVKGDSETHPILSPDDNFANFETWNGWYSDEYSKNWDELNEIQRKRKRFEYARSALKLGLGQKALLGVNPFKFGMIGSTDSHNSLPSVQENNFWGSFGPYLPNPERIKSFRISAAGYAAVWAKENTRESLFAAMKRREVYASTGPRVTVRFFGGWSYESKDAFKPDLARIGYSKGVPMGGDLTAAPENLSPSFLIRAVKDPDGANLDRVQVIKGWLDAGGELHEKIYNVALADDRKDKGVNTKPVGNTVSLSDANYINDIGDPELAVVWRDPDFDPQELAFYYLRVLEIPTPRWTAYDAKYFNLKDIPDEVPMITQERIYTSPIWYTPTGLKAEI